MNSFITSEIDFNDGSNLEAIFLIELLILNLVHLSGTNDRINSYQRGTRRLGDKSCSRKIILHGVVDSLMPLPDLFFFFLFLFFFFLPSAFDFNFSLHFSFLILFVFSFRSAFFH